MISGKIIGTKFTLDQVEIRLTPVLEVPELDTIDPDDAKEDHVDTCIFSSF